MRHPRGIALPIVLWAVVVLAALALTASLAGRLELALARHHRDHAAALAWAESGLADALAAAERAPPLPGVADSIARSGTDGTVRVRWTWAGARLRFHATGTSGGARRAVEAWGWRDAAGGLRVEAWREVIGETFD